MSMTVPYAPTPFTSPILNPRTAVYGLPVPLISSSYYLAAPTAMDTYNLIASNELDSTGNSQAQALADVIRRASNWANRVCFGADPSGVQASLAISEREQNGYVKILQSTLRLRCSYKPVVAVTGIDVGTDPSTTRSIGQGLANRTAVKGQVITVPLSGYPILSTPQQGGPNIQYGPGFAYGGTRAYVVWSYWQGYPHYALAPAAAITGTLHASTTIDSVASTAGILANAPISGDGIPDGTTVVTVSTNSFTISQAADASGATPLVVGYPAGASAVNVTNYGPNDYVVGVYPNSQMQCYDMTDVGVPAVEELYISSVSGATLTLTNPLVYSHLPPSGPDFIPVSTLPDDVFQAIVWLTTALIKTRGDNSLVLDGITEPRTIQGHAFDGAEDVANALERLQDFSVAVKMSA